MSFKDSAFLRIGLSLTLLTCSILLVLDLVGLAPSPLDTIHRSRLRLCESVALHTAVAAEDNDFAAIRVLFAALVRRNEEVLSAGMRLTEGRLLVATPDHRMLWTPESEEGSTLTHARVALVRGGQSWATLEVRFAQAGASGPLGRLWERPLIRLLLLVAPAGFLVYTLFMKRKLRHLDPSAVIPPRVQAAFDVLAEGVLLVDRNDRIVLTNAAFADRLGTSPGLLMGVTASRLSWRVPGTSEPAREFPWLAAMEHAERQTGVPMGLAAEGKDLRTFFVNAAPIFDGGKDVRGAIATFDDVTELERKSQELQEALALVEKSREEIRLQNEELTVLARCDPLTGLSNRRCFLEQGEAEFTAAKREDLDLCFLMADIDHFKRVNDNHGHAVGDEVIICVAEELLAGARDRALVCRYGGEEFCALLVGIDIEEAMEVAERLRLSVAAEGFASVPVTASFGVSSIRFSAPKLHDMIKQADEALYSSKESGRNRVTRWDRIGSSPSPGDGD